jgi:hypothetical protein
MSLFKCPLCGKRNSLRLYDPSNYESDIIGIDVTGLGRGGGFVDIDNFSLLDDSHLTTLITERCRKILGFIKGSEPASNIELQSYIKANREWSEWGKNAQRELNEKNAIISDFESEKRRLNNENYSLREQLKHRGPSIHQVENEQLQKDLNKWVKWGAQAEKQINDLSSSTRRLENEITRLKQANTKLREQIDESDDENIYEVEMEELLERINDSSNTDYNNLSDAIDWLLEQ